MGGNAGTQTLAIVVRSIALGEVKWGNNKRLVLKEIFLGVINGAATGAITGVLIYFMFGNVYLGWIIFAAMICNLVIAGFFGFLVPLILKAMLQGENGFWIKDVTFALITTLVSRTGIISTTSQSLFSKCRVMTHLHFLCHFSQANTSYTGGSSCKIFIYNFITYTDCFKYLRSAITLDC